MVAIIGITKAEIQDENGTKFLCSPKVWSPSYFMQDPIHNAKASKRFISTKRCSLIAVDIDEPTAYVPLNEHDGPVLQAL